jgi:hypothetical protein
MYRIVCIATDCVSIKHVSCTAHIHIITGTYFRNIILLVIFGYVYKLLPYEISHFYVHWYFFIRNRNLTKYFFYRHLDILQSINMYLINFYISARSTKLMFCKTYPSHLQCSSVHHCVITKCM